MARTAAVVQSELDDWYAARQACARGRQVQLGDTVLTRQDLALINQMIDQLEGELADVQSTHPRGRKGIVGFKGIARL